MESNRDRVISIVLNEAEWQAFVSVHPQPVVWLREKIQESIVAVPSATPTPISRFSAAGAESTTSATTR
jgi:hypothetical protein